MKETKKKNTKDSIFSFRCVHHYHSVLILWLSSRLGLPFDSFNILSIHNDSWKCQSTVKRARVSTLIQIIPQKKSLRTPKNSIEHFSYWIDFFFFFSKRTTTKALATHLRRCQNEGGQGTFSLMYVQSLDERFFIWYRIDLISASYFSSVPHSHQTDYLSSSSNMLVIMSVFGADPESSSFSLRFKLKHIKSRMRYDAKWSLLNR